MIVVDASVIVDFLLGSGSPAGDEFARMLGERLTLVAPELLDLEAAQAIRRFEQRGEVSEDRGRTMISDLADLPVVRYPHRGLVARAYEFRHSLTVYDAIYLSLAERLGGVLYTGDSSLSAFRGSEVTVRHLTTSR